MKARLRIARAGQFLTFLCLLAAVATVLCLGSATDARAQTEDLVVDPTGVVLVGRSRVGRIGYQYRYRLSVENQSANNATNVAVEFSTSQSGITVLEANLPIGDVGAGETVNSSTEFVVQAGRRTRVDTRLFQFTTSGDFEVADTDPPVITITSPLANALIGADNVEVTGTTDDDTATITVNGVAATVADGLFTANAVPLTEGANTLTATATDPAGNAGTASVNVVSDTTEPAVAIVSPSDGQTVPSNVVNVTGTVSDTNGVQSVVVNGVTATVTDGAFTANNVTLTALNEIIADALDNAGNSGSDAVAVVVDDGGAGGEDEVPVVSISSPEPLTILSQNSVTVTGNVDRASTVTVNGVAATVDGDNNFEAVVPLVEGVNTLVAVATADGLIGIDTVEVTLDTTPPTVSILAPSLGAILTSTQVTVVGNVNDIVTGTVNGDDVDVTVNGVPARVLNRSFEVRDLLLVRGANQISVVARDASGNESEASIDVEVRDGLGQQKIVLISGNNQSGGIGASLPEPLVVEVVDANGQVIPDLPITFSTIANDGSLTAFPQEGRQVTVNTDEFGRASTFFTLGSRSGVGNNMVSVSAPGFVGELVFCLSADPGEAARISAVSGENQTGITGSPLPSPLSVLVTDFGGNPLGGVDVTFAVAEGDGNIGGLPVVVVPTNSDGRAATSFTLGPQDGINNNQVIATVAALPDDLVAFVSSGKTSDELAPTTLVGVVVDNSDVPIPNAKVQVIGDDNTELTTFTDEVGRFQLIDIPIGQVHLLVDGTTTTRPEIFTFLAFSLTTFPGVENSLGMPISIPILNPDNAQLVGGDEDVVLTMEGVDGVEFTIFANSATFPSGEKVGFMSVNQVHTDRVPMPPPDGTSPAVVWTLQPANVHFDPPVAIKLPNAEGLAAGTVVELLSFDHDLETFVSVGIGRVSEDASSIVSDPGFGITKSGWGTPRPPPRPKNCTLQCNDKNSCTSDSKSKKPCKCNHVPTNENGNCGSEDGPGPNACRDGGKCKTGKCVGGTLKPENSSCDDGLFCTDPDKCESGVCKGKKKDDDPESSVTFNLRAINLVIGTFNRVADFLDAGIPPIPEIDGELAFKKQMVCCEQKDRFTKKDTIEGVLKIKPDYDSGRIRPPLPYAKKIQKRILGRVVGFQYGLFIQFTAGMELSAKRETRECEDDICWGGGFKAAIGITVGGDAGVVNSLLPPICGPNEDQPCFAILATVSASAGLSAQVAVQCDKIEAPLGFSGLKAKFSLMLFSGTIIETNFAFEIVIINPRQFPNSIDLPK